MRLLLITDEPDWESRMRELSGQLSAILKQIKKAKESRPVKYSTVPEKPKPKVIILRNVSSTPLDFFIEL